MRFNARGLDLRRIREHPTPAGAPRQAFFRLGAEILELIQEPSDSIQRAGAAQSTRRASGVWRCASRISTGPLSCSART